jgi:hypothetical protein
MCVVRNCERQLDSYTDSNSNTCKSKAENQSSMVLYAGKQTVNYINITHPTKIKLLAKGAGYLLKN